LIAEETLFSGIRALGAKIQSREISPVELTEAYLERSRTIGARLNAYATLTTERALREAREAERDIAAGRYRGVLHGIPYAAKDLLAAEGYPTAWGAKPYASQQLDYDAHVVRKLRDAGAVLLGKAAMIELAGGMGYRYGTASVSGGAKNPWDERCWTCGSSSGSGAVMAAGLAAFAIGTETWGSIVCPSAYCGVSGLRPTFGRVGRSGAMALSYSMDKIGPMARSAEDCGIVLRAIAGHDSADRGSLPQADAQFAPLASTPRLRIGRVTNAWTTMQPDIAQITDRAFTTLREAGAEIVDVTLPDGPWEMAAAVTIQVEGASAFDKLIDSGGLAELTDPGSRVGGYVNQTISGADYVRAQRLRQVIQQKIDALFDRVDLLAAASLPIAATTMETNLETDLAFSDPLGGIGNFCGLPAISVPSGFTSKNLPAGIQFVGRVLDDAKCVAAAQLFQSRTDWHRRRPVGSRTVK
jgi:aspartyl-tRNA(Asn)/glutamyl-tRNA(Gln) amidotransferase subunit A